MNKTCKILLVDDHAIVRQGFRLLLEASNFTVCGEAADGEEAVKKAMVLKPDLVLMDVGMPVMGGLDATREICRLSPATKVIVVSMQDSSEGVVPARQAGASAYVPKTCRAVQMIDTIKDVIKEEGIPA